MSPPPRPSHRPSSNGRAGANGRPALASLTQDELLSTRMCDLGLKIKGTPLERRVDKLYRELGDRGILHRPHVWLSSEWFSPDGVPGIALPFYLAHKRLMKLEERQMLEVEGGNERDCMRLLRHEAGHTVCTAYRLHYRKRWREVFGRFTQPYPDTYQPRPDSRSYVLHLGSWYAQSHPAEDFAETFAVWLQPRSRWREQYRGWPALRKLEYVDEVMSEIAGVRPPVNRRDHVEPLSSIKTTLEKHYRKKRRKYMEDFPDFHDRDLRRLFSDEPRYAQQPTAASFIRTVQPEIRRAVAEWTSEYQYTIDQVLRDMIDRCKELKLRLARPEDEAKTHLMLLVTVRTMNYLHGGHHRIAL